MTNGKRKAHMRNVNGKRVPVREAVIAKSNLPKNRGKINPKSPKNSPLFASMPKMPNFLTQENITGTPLFSKEELAEKKRLADKRMPSYFRQELDFDLENFADATAKIKPIGRKEAVNELIKRRPEMLYTDALLEGSTVSEPEVQDFLAGEIIYGHSQKEIDELQGLKEATDWLIDFCNDNANAKITEDIARNINYRIGSGTIKNRGFFRKEGEKVLVRVKDKTYYSPVQPDNDSTMEELFCKKANEVNSIEYPALRAITWSCVATYEQFFRDRNKRTARYVANAVLVSHGYKPLIIGIESKDAYLSKAIDNLFTKADANGYIETLLKLYDRT
jgi:Fic family protein